MLRYAEEPGRTG